MPVLVFFSPPPALVSGTSLTKKLPINSSRTIKQLRFNNNQTLKNLKALRLDSSDKELGQGWKKFPVQFLVTRRRKKFQKKKEEEEERKTREKDKKKYLEHERGELKCMTINKPQRRSNINRQRTRVMGNSTGRGFPQNIGK